MTIAPSAIRSIRKTTALQVGDVVLRDRKGFQHGKRPFVVIEILNSNECLAVPTSTTVDFLGRMPAIKAGNKASWIAPNGIARIKRDRYTSIRRLDERDVALCWKAFAIWQKVDPRAAKAAIKQAKTAGKR